jgi:hypothetical protein
VLGGLQHDGVPGDERAARGARGQRDGVVEGADDAPHTVGTKDASGLLRLGELLQRDGEAIVLLHLVTVVTDEIRRLLDLTEGLELILSDLVGDDRGELVHAFGDEVRGP